MYTQLAGRGGLFIQDFALKNTNFRWEQSSLVCVRWPVCSCAGLCYIIFLAFPHTLLGFFFLSIHFAIHASIRVSFILGCQGDGAIQGPCLSWEIHIACGHLENAVLLCVTTISCRSTSGVLPSSSSPDSESAEGDLQKTTVPT